jgi:tRNA (uracil-5-)-methyltransferase TRM9
VNAATAARLLEIDHRFYEERARDFSETRLRVQPGVKRILDSLRGDETILDLGCGNGQVARTLSDRGHRAPYLGLDFSLPLLDEARRQSYAFPVQFVQADLAHSSLAAHAPVPLTSPSLVRRVSLITDNWRLMTDHWSVIVAFAVLHHIPGHRHRLELLQDIRGSLRHNGQFVLSSWQFLTAARMRARIQPWAAAGLTAEDVDPNDYLLDWRRGGIGLRYVHQFDEMELADLAAAAGFRVVDSFYSDGANRRSGLYMIWKKA